MVATRLTLDQLSRRAQAAAAELRAGRQEAYQRLRPMALQSVRSNFEHARDPVTGRGWPPLKVRKGRPLVLTGRLLASVRVVARETGLTAEATAPYAGFHNEGTSRIPRRRFLGFVQADLNAMAKVLADEAALQVVRRFTVGVTA